MRTGRPSRAIDQQELCSFFLPEAPTNDRSNERALSKN
jgi:hypothetical protein